MSEAKVGEDLRHAVSAVRRAGSEFNLSIPPSKLKDEAEKLIEKCQRVIALLGEA